MRSTKQMSITLTKEMAEAIEAKVAKGEYASESEVIRDGLRALFARDQAVEHWLKTQVAPAYDALLKDPSRGIPLSQVAERLTAESKKARGG